MLKDLRHLPPGAVIEADLCIIGSGAAGITLARSLRGKGFRICLLESGSFEVEPAVQDLYKGGLGGLPYWDLDVARLRTFGGSTMHWEGMCAPLMPHDFERRSHVPHSGWPISHGDLAPYYPHAHAIVRLGPVRYALDDWLPRDRRLPSPARTLERVYQYSPPVRFGTQFRQDLIDAPDVEVVIHANATRIDLDEAGWTVAGLRLASLDGHTATARATHYVLACGGIENARLLLASRGVQPDGVGNAYGVVGRYFMEHYELWPGEVTMTAPKDKVQPYFGFNDGTGMYVKPCFVVDPRVQADLGLANGGLILDSAAYHADVTGFVALRRLLNGLRQGDFDEAGASLPLVLADLDDVAEGTWRKLKGQRYRPLADDRQEVRVKIYGEQVPNPDSRVRLGEDLDALGQPRAVLDWRLSDLDRHTAVTSARIVGEGLAAEGAGRMRLAAWVADGGWPDSLQGAMHHMGTTRMSASPRDGVVDAQCRVHGMENLFVAGSSVFPTGGYANPTLTIVAMTLRLADHLGRRLRADSRRVEVSRDGDVSSARSGPGRRAAASR